jgi:hypothetical protein
LTSTGNARRSIAVFVFVNAYLWHTGDIRHYLRAETLADARERIAATHGDETARRAVIRPLETARTSKADSAAA